MRIGIDASNLRAGGGLTHISELLKSADPMKYGINRVIVWGGKLTLERLPSEKSWLRLIHVPLLDRPLPLRLYWQKIRLPQIAKRECDILFLPGGSNTGFKPYITMSQNMLPFKFSEMKRYGISQTFFRLFILRMVQTRSFRKASGMIFLTDYARSMVMKKVKYLHGQYTVIPHGIDRRFYSAPKEQKPIDAFSFENPYRLLYVSIIDLYKHQWHVAEAVAKLRQEGIPVVLDLVGPAYPPASKRLKQTISKIDAEGNFIRYVGNVPYSQLHSYYHHADMFIFASSCENMPNILSEAMASGLPIASSHSGPMPEVLGDAGIYFDPEQPESIADALRALITNHDLRKRCAWTAFEKANAFSWERCADETFSFIAQTFRRFRDSHPLGVTSICDNESESAKLMANRSI